MLDDKTLVWTKPSMALRRSGNNQEIASRKEDRITGHECLAAGPQDCSDDHTND